MVFRRPMTRFRFRSSFRRPFRSRGVPRGAYHSIYNRSAPPPSVSYSTRPIEHDDVDSHPRGGFLQRRWRGPRRAFRGRPHLFRGAVPMRGGTRYYINTRTSPEGHFEVSPTRSLESYRIRKPHGSHETLHSSKSAAGGAWTCPKCLRLNGGSREECFNCLLIKPEDAIGRKTSTPFIPKPASRWRSTAPLMVKARLALKMYPGAWPCKRCSTPNGKFRERCIKCGEPKFSARTREHVEVQKWQCAMCYAMNPATAEICLQCDRRDKGEVVVAEKSEDVGEGTKEETSAVSDTTIEVKPRKVAWKCKKCKTTNRASMDKCTGCQAPIPASVKRVAQQILKGKAEKVAGAARAWRCKKCKGINLASRKECNKCKEPRVTESGEKAADKKSPKGSSPTKVERGGNTWKCPGCTNFNLQWRSTCNKCGQANPRATGETFVQPTIGPDGKEVRVGDWICKKCSENNFAWRKSCFTCKLLKKYSEEAFIKDLPEGSDLQDVLRKIWSCRRCQSCVLTSDKTCPECRNKQPDTVPQDGNAPALGIVVCVKCEQTNWPTRSECSKCKEPLPIAKAAPGAEGWACEGCGFDNAAHDDACAGCSAPRVTSLKGCHPAEELFADEEEYAIEEQGEEYQVEYSSRGRGRRPYFRSQYQRPFRFPRGSRGRGFYPRGSRGFLPPEEMPSPIPRVTPETGSRADNSRYKWTSKQDLRVAPRDSGRQMEMDVSPPSYGHRDQDSNRRRREKIPHESNRRSREDYTPTDYRKRPRSRTPPESHRREHSSEHRRREESTRGRSEHYSQERFIARPRQRSFTPPREKRYRSEDQPSKEHIYNPPPRTDYETYAQDRGHRSPPPPSRESRPRPQFTEKHSTSHVTNIAALREKIFGDSGRRGWAPEGGPPIREFDVRQRSEPKTEDFRFSEVHTPPQDRGDSNVGKGGQGVIADKEVKELFSLLKRMVGEDKPSPREPPVSHDWNERSSSSMLSRSGGYNPSDSWRNSSSGGLLPEPKQSPPSKKGTVSELLDILTKLTPDANQQQEQHHQPTGMNFSAPSLGFSSGGGSGGSYPQGPLFQNRPSGGFHHQGGSPGMGLPPPHVPNWMENRAPRPQFRMPNQGPLNVRPMMPGQQNIRGGRFW